MVNRRTSFRFCFGSPDSSKAVVVDIVLIVTLLSQSVKQSNVWGACGAWIAQWLERRTRDWRVARSNPCRSGGRIVFSGVSFLFWLLFRYPFHPSVTAVARKRSRSFCQKGRKQVTAEDACTLRKWLCMKWHGAWLYDVHRTRRDGSSFMWHQPCHATEVDLKKRYKKLSTHVESHISAMSLLESGK